MLSNKGESLIRWWLRLTGTVRNLLDALRVYLRAKTYKLILSTSLGSFKCSRAVGKNSAEKHADDIQEDAIFLLASQTKLLIAIAALQLIEQSLIQIHDNVEEWLPELSR